MDEFFSCNHLGNLVSICDVIFPVSNFTVSYNLIKKIDFWDTSIEAIADENHFVLNAFVKTKGIAKSVPIYIPINQACIQTGDGYLQDVYDRLKQA